MSQVDDTGSSLLSKRSTESELSDRSVSADPMGDWYLSLPSKLPPKQVESILRMALAGNPWQQYQLTQRMRDSWPMFKKCEFELRNAISSAKFVVHPFANVGEEPSKTAIDKANLITRTLESFKPDRFAEEEGFRGMVYDITDAVINGVAICELIWDEKAKDQNGYAEKRIRASAFVHPRHYSFKADGTIGIAPSETTNTLQFPSQQKEIPVLNNPSKFIVAKAKTKSGTPLGAGFMRPLAYAWCTVMYGREFMLSFSQKYGNPFMAIPYQSGISQAEIAVFESLAKRAANQGWCVHPNTGEVKITPAQSLGGESAHVQLIKMADEMCQVLMLGQTLTSSTPSSGGGSRAQGAVHENVRQERIEGLLKWVADILTTQFCESVIYENYGETSERPHIEPDLTRPLDTLEQAQYLAVLSTSTVPLPVEDTYKKLGVNSPAQGDRVMVGGKIGILGDVSTEIEANPSTPSWDMDYNQQPQSNAGKVPEVPEADKTASGEDLTKAKVSGVELRSVLATLSPEDLAEVNTLVLAAKTAPHANGELTALNKKLSELQISNRL